MASIYGLTSILLHGEVEEGRVPPLGLAYIQEVVESGGEFTPQDCRTLLGSPLSRERYQFAYQKLRLRAMQRLRAAGFGDESRLAADSEGHELVYKGFTLSLVPDSDPRIAWSLTVLLDAAFLERLGRGLKIRLVDNGGLVWLTGRPNRQGAVVREPWPLGAASSPRERLDAYPILRIEPC